MASPERILASTLSTILDEATEAAYNDSVLFKFLKETAGFNADHGGDVVRVPVETAQHSNVTFLSVEGSETVDESYRNILRPAIFEWEMAVYPIVIPARDRKINEGKEGIVKLLDVNIRNATAGAISQLNQFMLAGAVTSGHTPGILQTLYGAAGAGAGTGWLEGVAKASQNNVVGGLSKATYNIPGWTNAWASAGGAFNTANAGRIAMSTIQAQIMQVSGNSQPVDVVICSPEMFALYKASLVEQERYVDASSLDGGNYHLMFGGAKVYLDAALSNSYSWSGDNIFSAYFLKKGALELAFCNGKGFELEERGRSMGSAHDTWQASGLLQLVAKNLGKMGVLTNGNA